ncbi:divalent-cation tolerance protein CutA [Streptomyces sp. Q6]|uniref:Divalent-cation tolerance protein CutA n=1 Tax=Streptomyces citrinus TaxID=3118173 RepID=A0ACD5AAF9_9ACTN
MGGVQKPQRTERTDRTEQGDLNDQADRSERAGSGVLAVLTTTDSREKADALARDAVAARLAACVQIGGPVTSVYRWEGDVESAQEWQVLLKTTEARYAELEGWLTERHDYETPEIVALPVVRGGAGYLAWVHDETSPA